MSMSSGATPDPQTNNNEDKMSNYKAIITPTSNGGYYGNVVKGGADGEYRLLHGYSGREFKTLKGAEKSTSAYISKMA